MDLGDIHIRPAVTEDAVDIACVRSDAIRAIDTRFYNLELLDAWAGGVEDRVQALLSNDAGVRIVVEIADEIVGYGELVAEKNILGACYVSSKVSRCGVGRMIVERLEAIAREKGLSYLQMDSSTNAESFYNRLGYVSLKASVYVMKNGAVMDSVMMRKDLI